MANRLALVIGNNYRGENAELRSCTNDADEMSGALERVGFSVTKHHDLDNSSFKRALRTFRDTLKRDDTALFYFSGHGISIGGSNFLCPISMPGGLKTAADFEEEAISDQRVAVMASENGAQFKIIITDACRTRPGDDPIVHQNMKGAGGGGAAKMSFVALQQSDMAANTYVIHSSGEATPSFAGDARSMSVFTAALVPLLGEPGLELTSMGKKLQKAVRVASEAKGCKMICEKTDKMEDNFYFNGDGGGAGGYGGGEGKEGVPAIYG